MAFEKTDWNYNEFLAFILIYAAGVDCDLAPEQLTFISTRTQVGDIEKICSVVNKLNDAAILDIIEEYRKKYLNSSEKAEQAKADLENLLKTPGEHSQIEKVGIHMIEKIIVNKPA